MRILLNMVIFPWGHAPAPLGAVLALLLLATSAAAQDPAPQFAWRFSQDRVAENQLQPVAGELKGTLHGAIRFEEKPACAVIAAEKARVTVTDDLASAKLPTEAVVVEAWVAVERPTEWGGIAGAFQDNGAYERGWVLGYKGSRFCFAVAGREKKTLTYLIAPEDFIHGAWYYVVGVYDGGKQSLYVDGRLVASAAEQRGPIEYPPKGFLTLGAYHDDNELYPLQGKLAEVAIFGRPLAAEQIAARFQARPEEFPGSRPEGSNEPAVGGWPTWQHDFARSGLTSEKLTAPLRPLWTYRARQAPQPAWPPPAKQDFWNGKPVLEPRIIFDRALSVVSDGRLAFFGSSADDQIRALDLATGEERWAFATEGPVRLAPSLDRGRLFAGSDDGRVYCLAAADGKLLWRHEGVTPQRKIPGNGRMISAWPVRTGVLVDGDRVRWGAGLFPTEGTWQFVVDAATGREIGRTKLAFSPQGYLERRAGNVLVAQGNNPATAFFDRLTQTGKTTTEKLGKTPAEFPYAFVACPGLRFAGGEGKIAAIRESDGSVAWRAEVEGKAYSLAIAGGKLLASTDMGVIYCFEPGEAAGPAKVVDRRMAAGDGDRADGLPIRPTVAEAADKMVAAAKTKQGYGLVLGLSEGELALAMAARTKMQLVCVEPDEKRAAAVRKRIDERGLAGRVTVHVGPLTELPYGPGLFNLVLSERLVAGEKLATPRAEIERILRPEGGVAVLGLPSLAAAETWLVTPSAAKDSEVVWKSGPGGSLLGTRGPRKGGGEWTHLYGEPGNSANSGDRLVGTAFDLAWWGLPGPREMIDRHHRTVSPLFVAGKLLVPGNERVYGVDAYNGTVLWEAPLAGTRRVGVFRDCGSMATAGDRLYVAAGPECLALDTATGAIVRRIATPKRDAAAQPAAERHWGYTAVVDDLLLGSATRPGAIRSNHSRAQLTETFYDFIPLVTSDALFACDRASGEPRWTYRAAAGAIVNSTVAVGGGRVYFIESADPATLAESSGRLKLERLVGKGASLVALDLASGREAWREKVDLAAIQHVLFLSHADGRLVIAGSRNQRTGLFATCWYDIHCHDAATGKPLWKQTQDTGRGANGDHGEQDHHPAIIAGVVYAEPFAYDLATGKKKKDWNFQRGGHGCGTIAGCPAAIFFRAANPTLCDLASGKLSKVNTVSRPGCWINILPAGGMLLIPDASSGCSCNFPVQASMGFWPK